MKDPMAAATTKTRDLQRYHVSGGGSNCDGGGNRGGGVRRMGGHQPRHCLDNAILRLADGILLCLIALMTVGTAAVVAAAAAAAAGSPATMMTSMPAINIEALFIGREERGGDNNSCVATEDDDNDANTSGGVRVQFLGGHAHSTLGGVFWQEDDNSKDDGDKQGQQA